MSSESYQGKDGNGRQRFRIVSLPQEAARIDTAESEILKILCTLRKHKAALELYAGETMDEFEESLRRLTCPSDE